MIRTRLFLLGLLATVAITATVATLVGRTLAAAVPTQPAVEAEDTLSMQSMLRYRQCQPHHWRYVMLRQ
jgi:hypothetical protein